jgi:ketosteroid isomerase-like protein
LAVSRDRVELIRAMFETWNTGARGLAVLREYLDPGIELEGPLSSVLGAPYRGYEGIEQWTRDIDEHFSQWSIRPEDVREIGDRVMATVNVTARPGAATSPSTSPQERASLISRRTIV